MTAKTVFTLSVLFTACYQQGSTYSEAVCSGEQIEVTCHTNDSVLLWNIYVPHFTEGTDKAIFEANSDNVTEVVPLGAKRIPFQFTKTLNSLLMSALVVDGAHVNSDLNGTMVNCTGISKELILTTTILVTGNDSVIPNLSVNTIEEHFGTENVTVVLEWDKDEHITYNVTVVPHVPLLYINETVIQLTVPYNSFHFVSVVATLCDHNAANVTKLHYDYTDHTTVRCESPPKISSATGLVVLNIDVMAPALLGSNATVTVSCSEEFNKTYTIICMSDGKWHPEDHSHKKCEEAGSTSVGLRHIIAVCTSVTIFIIVIFIMGFTCSITCRTKCITRSTRASDAQLNQSEPIYSECTYPLKISQQEETPEMVENVAYGLVK